MPVALDLKQTIDTNLTAKPALHPSCVDKMMFVSYRPPPNSLGDRAQYEMWLEGIGYLCEDLHWLLQQPHDKFWCQVIFDEKLHKSLDSFLRYCPRTQEALSILPDSGRHKHLELCRLIFMTYLRMSTHKESKECFITPSVFSEILYENFLFDIPKLFDICALFGKSNGPLLTKMVCNIFSQQPKYLDDLKDTISTIVQVFNNMASQCGVKLDSFVITSPQKLQQQPLLKHSGGSMKTDVLQDLVMYLYDTATTLHKFLEVYPKGCQIFAEAQFHSLLANFYEGVITALTENIKQGNHGSLEWKKTQLIRLHHSKKALLSIFHLIVNHVCLLPVIENGTDQLFVSSRIEEFLHIMTSVLNERQFLAAYESLFVFQDDVDLLVQASSIVDVSQFEYIQSAINLAFATFGRRKSPHGDTNTGGRTSPDGAVDSGMTIGATAANSNVNFPQTSFGNISHNTASCTASKPKPRDVEIESLICAVKDILPHLGDGFVYTALEEMGWNQEQVISCVLEDSLPAALQGLRFDEPRQERAVNQGDGQTQKEEVSLVDSRRNVFDGDEFDVFHNDNVKFENMHQGKKKVSVDPKDENVDNIVRSRYSEYGSWEKPENQSEETTYDYEAHLMYDDEYDDTYDTTNIGADDADSADELLANKTIPRVLADLERKKAKMEGRLLPANYGDESDEDEDDQAVKRDEFVQDPAKLREQAAQRRISQASRGRRGAGSTGGPPKNYDVKGGPKGQGQSKEVAGNRRAKEKFKGQRNRANADKKMSKGMF